MGKIIYKKLFDFIQIYVEVKSSSPSLPYIPISFTSLSANHHRFSTFPFPEFPFPIYLTFLLPPSSTSLPCPFRSSRYFSFPLNLSLSLSIFSFPSKPSRPYFSSSLPISFPSYPLLSLPPPYLPTSPPFPFFRCYPFAFLFSLPFPFSFPLYFVIKSINQSYHSLKFCHCFSEFTSKINI